MQYGFIRGKSTTTQLLEVYHEILESVACGNEVDDIYLDVSKAFATSSSFTKLETLGIRRSLLAWFQSYLTDRKQRVVLQGIYSKWLPGVPQGPILGPLLFLVYCNDISTYIKGNSALALFSDDSKLYRPLLFPTSSNLLQHDLCNIAKWSADNEMDLKATKCMTVHISKKITPLQTQYSINENILEQVSIIKDLGVLMTNNLSWSKRIETLYLFRKTCHA